MSVNVMKCHINVTGFRKNHVLQYNRKDDRKDKFHYKFSFHEKASSEMAVLFCWRKEVIMPEARTIYCPNCHRKVGSYDGKSTMNKYIECRKCRKMVCFYPDRNETEVKPIPPRATASGMTFI